MLTTEWFAARWMKMFFGLEWSKMNNRKYINKSSTNKSSTNKSSTEQGKIIPLFSTPVMKISLGREFTKDETDCFQNIPITDRDNFATSTNHQSKDFFLFDNFAEELKDIKKFIEFYLKQYLEEIQGVDTNLANLRITQSWLNRTKPGESHDSHSHHNSYLSGVLYIKCLPNDCINLKNRLHKSYNNIEFPKKKSTEWNATVITVNVKKGDLVLFPSWVPHNVDVNNTDKERISLSFNTFPIGELGEYHGATHLKL